MTVHVNRKIAGQRRRKVRPASMKPLRRAGLRRVALLVPDTCAPSFAAEVRRQVRRLARSRAEAEEMDFIEAVQADNPLE